MFALIKKYQVFWWLAKVALNLVPPYLFKKIPKEIIIEPTNACNLRCPVCPTNLVMKRERGFIDFELFKSIIDEFRGCKEKPKISMNFAGEPLLHPQIDRLVSYASKNQHKTFISTNACNLTVDLSKRLILAGLSHIHLCIDGMTKKSHEAYRIGSNFEVVKKNIENFMLTRDALKSKNPFVTVQTLLTSFSENEIDEIKKWGEAIGADELNFKSLSLGSYTSEDIRKKYQYLLPLNPKFRRRQSQLQKTVCLGPLRTAVVFWNGDLGLCCVDFDNILKMPNIKKNGFLETFKSKEAILKRRKGFKMNLGLCQKCSLRHGDYLGVNFKLK